MRFVVDIVLLGLVVFLRLDKELWWFIRRRKEQREKKGNQGKRRLCMAYWPRMDGMAWMDGMDYRT